jgi:DNA-binding Lrp family transcriptional regulator
MEIDQLDREIINLIQLDIPLEPEPYKALAEKLGITEEKFLSRLERLIDLGAIRRLGGIFDSRKLGYTGTLCGVKAPPEKIEVTAEVINSFSGVTHNYLRDHEYNIWFTLLAKSKNEIDRIISEIKDRTGIQDIINLPSTRLYKIKVNFSVEEK